MKAMEPLLTLASDYLYYASSRIENPHHVTIPCGITVLIGPNGAGKSMLADIIERGRNFKTNKVVSHLPRQVKAKKMEFADIHSLRGITATGYYQQRYEATMNDEVPSVVEILERSGLDIPAVLDVCKTLSLEGIEEKKVNYLSSGELRKLLVATALTSRPDLLILDNPYIGLDVTSRAVLDEALQSLASEGVNVMLLVCDPRDIPAFATVVIPIAGMSVGAPVVVDGDINSVRELAMQLFDYTIDTAAIPPALSVDDEPVENIVHFDHCRVSYGTVTVLDDVDWKIKDNERWVLSGPNGSGKSTLLSMINADNPAAYRANITLFDRRRGTGESIWDIKRRIGYVSPEMKLYFTGTGDVIDVLGHGLVDTVGSFVRLAPSQIAVARMWMKLLHLEGLEDRRYNTLSAGERQLVLLARAMIKQPRLLILDEPMHGLDYGRKRSMRSLINFMAARADSPGSQHPMSMVYVTHRPDEVPECINNYKILEPVIR